MKAPGIDLFKESCQGLFGFKFQVLIDERRVGIPLSLVGKKTGIPSQ